MTKYHNDPALQGLTLGKSTDYCDQYNPQLLQPVPRALNRDDLQLTGSLPFRAPICGRCMNCHG